MTDEPTILGGFTNCDIDHLEYHLGDEYQESYIRLKCNNRKGLKRELVFHSPSNLEIQKDSFGSLSGMEVIDISTRQWDCAKIEVINYEQDPGMTFIAKSMEIILNEF